MTLLKMRKYEIIKIDKIISSVSTKFNFPIITVFLLQVRIIIVNQQNSESL